MKRTRHYSLITIAWLPLCLASCASKTETSETKMPPNADLIAENVSQADTLSKQHDDLPKLREAARLLAQIRNPDNRNYEVEWKFARCNYFLGKLVTDEMRVKRFLRKAKRRKNRF